MRPMLPKGAVFRPRDCMPAKAYIMENSGGQNLTVEDVAAIWE